MASKRKHNQVSLCHASIESGSSQARKSDSDDRNEYRGFSLQTNTREGEIHIPLEDGTIEAREFFDRYVAKRQPCVIDALPKLASGKFPSASLQELKQVAGEKTVQVERRCSTSETFGQNRTASRQILMTMTAFLEQWKNHDDGDLLYLSPQESDESNDPFQVPCRQLLDQGCIASHVPWAGRLILQSCNLWMGTSRNGSSSGLHHDYHDNFYLLIQGWKRFRIYSPDCAPFMYTHGEIAKVHFNGRISYVGSETRADGVPLIETAGDVNEGDNEGDKSDDDDDEEEAVLGKGFDYKSDSDSGGDFDEQKDDYDELMGTHHQEQEHLDRRPDHFSRIGVETLGDHTAIKERFPLFLNCRECIVELKEGQTLYLPAGWFHEVTSGNDVKCGNNTALNYWYHPPDDLDNFEQPYKHSYWSEHNDA